MRDWLIELRNQKGYTLKEMGHKLGISESYYSLIEKGDRQKRMDITLVAKLSDILDVSLENIIQMEQAG